MKPKVLVPAIFIIFLLAAIAVPSFVKTRRQAQQNACLNNMRILWSMAVSFGLAENVSPDQPTSFSDRSKYFGDAARWSTCPSGAEPYSSFSVFQGPACPNGHQFMPGVERPIKAQGPKLVGLYQGFGFTNLIEEVEQPAAQVQSKNAHAVAGNSLPDDDVDLAAAVDQVRARAKNYSIPVEEVTTNSAGAVRIVLVHGTEVLLRWRDMGKNTARSHRELDTKLARLTHVLKNASEQNRRVEQSEASN